MSPSKVYCKAFADLANASAILALITTGCFVVVGDLPEARQQDLGSGATGGAGSGGKAGSPATGGAGGTASGGVGGASGAATGGTSGSGAQSGSGGGSTGGGTAGGVGGGAGSGGACCDCDGDQHLAGGTCGGDDCDDHDALVKPDQTTFFETQSSTVGWDYNCSDQIERESEQVVQCGVLPGLVCTGQPEGWLASTAPPCGTMGKWGKCKLGPGGLTCVEDVLDPNKPVKCH